MQQPGTPTLNHQAAEHLARPDHRERSLQSPAESIGLIDGSFTVLNRAGEPENGWSVSHVMDTVDKETGVDDKVIVVVKPAFDVDGVRKKDHNGDPDFDAKVLRIAELQSMQPVEEIESLGLNEADRALEEIGSIPVESEVSIDEVQVVNEPLNEHADIESPKDEAINDEVSTPQTVTGVIQAQIDSSDSWAEHRAPLTDKSEPELSSDVTEAALQQKNEAAVETEAATPEVAQDYSTSEIMGEKFDEITADIHKLAQEAGPIIDKIVDLPQQLSLQIEDFIEQMDGGFGKIGGSIEGIRQLLNGVDTGFISKLYMDPSSPITNQDRSDIQNLAQVVSAVAGKMQQLQSEVEQSQEQGISAQALLSETTGDQTRNASHDLDRFNSEQVGRISTVIDAAGSELAHRAFEQDSEGDQVPVDERVTKGDEVQLDKLSHINGRLRSESHYLLDAVEDARNAVSRKLGSGSHDFTQNVLHSSALYPATIAELTVDLNGIADKLYMTERMNGSKGSLHAEIGYALVQKLTNTFSQIERFRAPRSDNPDMQTDLAGAKNFVKEAASTASGYVDQLQILARDSEK